MNLENILGKVVDALTGDSGQDQQRQPNVRPASEDPYGDPADQGYAPAGQYQGQTVLPASQDPYGDPADQYQGHQVLPASQDPLGDPADEEPQPAGRRGWPF
jgi:hypothetical protein